MNSVATQPHYRTRMFLYTLLFVAAGAALAAASMYILLPSGLGARYGTVLSSVRQIEAALAQKVTILYGLIAVAIMFSMVVLHLVYSHRVAGPAFRLGKEAARISTGNLSGRVTVRKKDNLTDMAESLNEVTVRYRGRLASIKKEIAEIEAQSERLSAAIAQGSPGPTAETLAEGISSNIRTIETVLSELRT
jgi:methyl-accepting chemotaxis protein